jgi:hypothetical protein
LLAQARSPFTFQETMRGRARAALRRAANRYSSRERYVYSWRPCS